MIIVLIFNKKPKLEEVIQEFMSRLNTVKPVITEQNNTRTVISVNTKGRAIAINLYTYGGKTVTVDIIDPFGIVRIPRYKLKKKEDLQMFSMVQLCKIIDEYIK